MHPSFRLFFGIAIFSLLSSCAPDYHAYRQHLPTSILVLPPLSKTGYIKDSYYYLSTITRPLAEAGYYVYPVAVTDALIKENGLATPEEMHKLPLTKVRDIIGADAVLYITLEQYNQTEVKAQARLVDVRTVQQLWKGTAEVYRPEAGGILAGILVGVLIHSATGVANIHFPQEDARKICIEANQQMVDDSLKGFLYGPQHPNFDEDQRGR